MIYPTRGHWCPGGGQFIMAGIAQIRGAQMSQRLTAGGDTVVASNTVSGKRCVIHLTGGNPGSHRMAGITLGRSRYVIDGLTSGGNAIMATAAHPKHLLVIHGRRRYRLPGDKITVTGFAYIAGGQV